MDIHENYNVFLIYFLYTFYFEDGIMFLLLAEVSNFLCIYPPDLNRIFLLQ